MGARNCFPPKYNIMDSNACIIIVWCTRQLCDRGCHTKNRQYVCSKETIPLYTCPMCCLYISQISYKYKCYHCSQTYCLAHFISHYKLNSLSKKYGLHCENEYLEITEEFMHDISITKCMRFCAGFKSNRITVRLADSTFHCIKAFTQMAALLSSYRVKLISMHITITLKKTTSEE